VGGEVVFQLFPNPTQIVGDELAYSLAGRTAIGDRILGDHRIDSGDAILSLLKEQVSKDGGKSLSLLELQQIAKTIEHKTAANEPRIVGGPLQIATIENGLAHLVEQPSRANLGGDPFPGIASVLNGGEISDGEVGILVTGTAILVRDSHLVRIRHQPLDRIFFFNTTFDHCALFYGGSPAFFFDRSNTVTDSTLELGPGVDANSPAIKRIRDDFPQLTIISTGHPAT
jgi:hypothetical protein